LEKRRAMAICLTRRQDSFSRHFADDQGAKTLPELAGEEILTTLNRLHS
jgi:hypothetical protein